MLKRKDIGPHLCASLLEYDAMSGELYWLPRPDNDGWTRRYAGKRAFTALSDQGYRVGKIFDILFRAHRVAWALHYGNWPTLQVDHINGNKADNRIRNLREVSNQENQRNVWRTKNNKSGTTGVHWLSKESLWCANIGIDRRQLILGKFKSKAEAVAVRKAAEVEYGFSPLHGL